MATIREQIMGVASSLFLERPGAKQSLAEWSKQLEVDGQAIGQRVTATKNATKAQSVLRHITGIERWGQRRLQVFLGQPLVVDEYDAYQPATELSTEEQLTEFRKTRAETVKLIRKITSKPNPESKVQHNSFGPLTVRGWARYLDMHANLESKKIR